MKTTIETLKETAAEFLKVADALNKYVSNYLDGSNDAADSAGYEMVKSLDRKFVNAYNDFYGERCLEYGLNYEAACGLVE